MECYLNSLIGLNLYHMKNKKSTLKDDMKNFMKENHDFLSALNKGASSEELNEIRRRIKRDEDDLRRIDRTRSEESDEAA